MLDQPPRTGAQNAVQIPPGTAIQGQSFSVARDGARVAQRDWAADQGVAAQSDQTRIGTRALAAQRPAVTDTCAIERQGLEHRDDFTGPQVKRSAVIDSDPSRGATAQSIYIAQRQGASNNGGGAREGVGPIEGPGSCALLGQSACPCSKDAGHVAASGSSAQCQVESRTQDGSSMGQSNDARPRNDGRIRPQGK